MVTNETQNDEFHITFKFYFYHSESLDWLYQGLCGKNRIWWVLRYWCHNKCTQEILLLNLMVSLLSFWMLGSVLVKQFLQNSFELFLCVCLVYSVILIQIYKRYLLILQFPHSVLHPYIHHILCNCKSGISPFSLHVPHIFLPVPVPLVSNYSYLLYRNQADTSLHHSFIRQSISQWVTFIFSTVLLKKLMKIISYPPQVCPSEKW